MAFLYVFPCATVDNSGGFPKYYGKKETLVAPIVTLFHASTYTASLG